MNVPGGGLMRSDLPGMTLRDYFAGQALAGLSTKSVSLPPDRDEAWLDAEIARSAFDYADAMLAERAKVQS
jgi:hypothetical protein